MSERENKRQLRTLGFIIAFDLLSACMTVPLFPILIKDAELGLLPAHVDFNNRNLLNGYLFGFYALAQFIGAPIVGALSDKYGRKKILSIVFVLNILQYLFIAVSIFYKSIALLFVSRIVSGLAGGTVFVEQSAIADLSTPKNKARNMGIVGASFGFGLIVGPILSTVLSDSSIYKGFNLTTPFLAILLINTINLVLLHRFFKETYNRDRTISVNFNSGIENIKRAIVEPQWRRLFLVIFIVTIGFMFFLQFFQIFLMEKFEMTIVEQGLLLAYCGLWMAISQGLILRWLTKFYSAHDLVRFSLPLFAIGYLLMLLPETKVMVYLFIPVMIVFQGLAFPSLLAIVSNHATKDVQGETIGINQSVQSLAAAVPALLVASFVTKWINFPFIFGAIMALLAWFLFLFEKNE